jgi:hypothetical protein
MKDYFGVGTVIQIFIAGFIFCIVLMMLFGLYHPHFLDVFRLRQGV